MILRFKILVFFFSLLTLMVSSQTAPVTSIGIITDAAPGPYTVPITVTGFNNVGQFTLTLNYTTTNLTYTGYEPNPVFPTMTVSHSIIGTLGKLQFIFSGVNANYTLPDLSTLFSVNFTYIAGNSYLTWVYSGTGNICRYRIFTGSSYLTLNDNPKSSFYIHGGIGYRGAPVTFAPSISNAVPGPIAVPVTVTNFDSIQVFNLNLEYDQNVLTYQSIVANPIFSGGLLAGVSMGPNGKMILTINCVVIGNYELPDGSTLLTINYNYSNTTGNYSELNWYDNGSSCDYSSAYSRLIDLPTADYYHNGKIYTQLAPKATLPSIADAIPLNNVDVPVLTTDFSNIYSFTLSFEYDTVALSYTGFTPNAELSAMTVVNNAPIAGKSKLVISYTGSAAKTLTDGSSIVDLSFTTKNASTNLTWITTDATSCRFNDADGKAYYDLPKSSFYKNGMVATKLAPITAAWQASPALGQQFTVPVRIYNFTDVGYFSLYLNYDPGVITYQSASLAAAIGGTFIASSPQSGRIIMTWSGNASTLADNSDLINLTFVYNGGSTPLAWYDDGNSCRYATGSAAPPFYDQPASQYYINGYVGPDPLIADFSASNTTPVLNTTVTLNDATTGNPTGWIWSITPSEFVYVNGTGSSSQNPQVQFTASGSYSIALVASRGTSSSIEVKNNYINAVSEQAALSCPEDVTIPSCPTLTTVNEAWNIFLESAIASGCSGALSNNAPEEPPSECGGSVEVTWIYTHNCGEPLTCSATFTVTAAPTLAVNCPEPVVLEACLDQAVVNDAFYSWIDVFGYSGGCNATSTDLSGYTAPDDCAGGIVSITYIATDDCGQSQICSSSFTVETAPSGIWTGTTSSDWMDETNWSNNLIPASFTDVVIPQVETNWPYLTGDLVIGGARCKSITIEGTAQLTVDQALTINTGSFLTFTGSGTLFMGGDWLNMGVFNPGSSNVEFTGTADAIIFNSGNTETFYKLTLSKINASLSVQGNINIIGIDNQE